jgi:peptidoglycan/LPS O-acetylase OafA/YrhL
MVSAAAAPIGQKHIYTGFIDGLRGIAAIWVVVAHCLIWGGYRGWIPDPKVAVDVFMVISGYLIALTYSSAEGAIAFYLRRGFRLLPVYYLVLSVAFATFDAYGAGYTSLQALDPLRWARSVHRPSEYVADLQSYLAHLTMLFGLAPRYSIGSMLPDWSLTLEWQFYLAFPFLLPVLLRRPALMAAIAFVAALLIWPVSRYPEPSFLLLKLPVFLIGCLCYLYHRSGGLLYLLAGLMLLAGHVWLSFRFLYGSQVVLFLAPVSVFYLGTGPWRWGRRLLGISAFKFFANASYSAYLTHGFFIAFVGSRILGASPTGSHALDLAMMVAAVLAGTYAVAGALFAGIERPLTAKGRLLAKRFVAARQAKLLRNAV